MSICAQIAKFERDLKALKMAAGCNKSCKKSVSKKAPKIIYDCTSKKELEKFTVSELKEFVEENKISTKHLSKMYKKDYIDLIWKGLKNSAKKDKKHMKSDNSSDSECESCDSDSGSESD